MIVLISCTNRPDSNSRIITGIYQSYFEEKGEKTSILDLQDLPVDFVFTALYGKEQKNPFYIEFQNLLDQCDKMIFIVPEYNASFPGILKAFIDGLRYPGSLEGKKAALVGLSSGAMGGALALSHLTDILHYLEMNVFYLKLKIPFIDQILDVENGIITQIDVIDKLKIHADEFLKW